MNFNAESGETEPARAAQTLVPRVPAPADENEVMFDQLEYLVEHVTGEGLCGCSDCRRYLRARAVLLEIFEYPAPAVRKAAATLPEAA